MLKWTGTNPSKKCRVIFFHFWATTPKRSISNEPQTAPEVCELWSRRAESKSWLDCWTAWCVDLVGHIPILHLTFQPDHGPEEQVRFEVFKVARRPWRTRHFAYFLVVCKQNCAKLSLIISKPFDNYPEYPEVATGLSWSESMINGIQWHYIPSLAGVC